MIYPVVLCGGSGTRLWPRSRVTRPKPFLPLVEEEARCSKRRWPAAPTPIARRPGGGDRRCSIAARRNAGRTGPRHAMIVEPMAKNTAPAIALAAHRCRPTRSCWCARATTTSPTWRPSASAAAAPRWRAKTGWCFARHRADRARDRLRLPPRRAARGRALAGRALRREARIWPPPSGFLAEGNYSWNGGIFAFRAGAFPRRTGAAPPGHCGRCGARRGGERGHEDGPAFHPDAGAFAAIDGESVDYAVMENTARAAVVPVAGLVRHRQLAGALPMRAKAMRRATASRGEVELVDCRNVLAETDGPRISVIGLEDIVVVVDGNEVLVTMGRGAESRQAERRGRTSERVLLTKTAKSRPLRLWDDLGAKAAPGRRRPAHRRDMVRAPGRFRGAAGEIHFTSESTFGASAPERRTDRGATGLGRQGKRSAGYMIAAEPGAKIGIGFTTEIDGETMRTPRSTVSIEHLLNWYPGDARRFLLHPGQHCPRDRRGCRPDRDAAEQRHHLPALRLWPPARAASRKGIAVARARRMLDKYHWHVAERETATLVDNTLFRLDQPEGAPSAEVRALWLGQTADHPA